MRLNELMALSTNALPSLVEAVRPSSAQLERQSCLLQRFNVPLFSKTLLQTSRRTTGQRHQIWNAGEHKRKRIANLCVQQRQTVSIPIHVDMTGKPKPLSEFFRQPAGMESMLNTNSLQSHEYLGCNVFRCTLPKLEILNFEVSPVVDLSVVTNEQDCTVEMLSCKFQGSEAVESQNEHFSATMRNRLTWDTSSESSSLEVNVELNVSLEVYTLPFKLLPLSAVERPGNAILQAMVDRMVLLFLDHLRDDYYSWAQFDDDLTDAEVKPGGDVQHQETSRMEGLK